MEQRRGADVPWKGERATWRLLLANTEIVDRFAAAYNLACWDGRENRFGEGGCDESALGVVEVKYFVF